MQTRVGRWMGFLLLLGFPLALPAQTPPPAPVLSAPANAASLVQPITLQWNAVVDPDGPIGSYTWQVGTSSTFSTVIASGFTNFDGDVPYVSSPRPLRDLRRRLAEARA